MYHNAGSSEDLNQSCSSSDVKNKGLVSNLINDIDSQQLVPIQSTIFDRLDESMQVVLE